jgi:hypothetical protein
MPHKNLCALRALVFVLWGTAHPFNAHTSTFGGTCVGVEVGFLARLQRGGCACLAGVRRVLLPTAFPTNEEARPGGSLVRIDGSSLGA